MVHSDDGQQRLLGIWESFAVGTALAAGIFATYLARFDFHQLALDLRRAEPPQPTSIGHK